MKFYLEFCDLCGKRLRPDLLRHECLVAGVFNGLICSDCQLEMEERYKKAKDIAFENLPEVVEEIIKEGV